MINRASFKSRIIALVTMTAMVLWGGAGLVLLGRLWQVKPNAAPLPEAKPPERTKRPTPPRPRAERMRLAPSA